MGVVNITDPNDSLYRYTNYEDSLFCLLDKVIGRLGGMISIRHQNGHRYLDILKDYPRACKQTIRFKENLMDYLCSSSSDQLATVVIPLGATVENRSIEAFEERVSTKRELIIWYFFCPSAFSNSQRQIVPKCPDWYDQFKKKNFLLKEEY